MIRPVSFEELRAEVLALPVEERAELAYGLVRSLDGEEDHAAEVPWIADDEEADA